jgi:drug/metabolite transporter (DMT)-like permease
MSWIYWALASAVIGSTNALIEKHLLNREHAMQFAASLSVVTACIAVPFLVLGDLSTLTPLAVAAIFAISVLAAIAYVLVVKAARHMEVSTVSPLLVLRPAFIALLAFVFLGESLTRLQAAGILLLVAGTYVLETHKADTLLGPIRELWSSKYVHFVILALFIYSCTALVDRYLLANMGVDPFAFIGLIHLFIMVNFMVMIAVFHDGFTGIKNGFRAGGFALLAVGLLTFAYRFASTMAVNQMFVGLVAPVTSLSAFFTTFIGGELFHEKNLARKTVACCIMLLGAAMVVI